jgi:hydroxypyruvate isomerase
LNLPSGDRSKGNRGIAANPNRVDEFRAGVVRAIEYALEFGVPQLNCLSGKTVTSFNDKQHWSTLIDNVRYAAESLQKKNLRMVVEAINYFDIPGFFLNRTDHVMKLIEEVGMPDELRKKSILNIKSKKE